MDAREGGTAKRILVPITPGAFADYALAATSAARIARKTGGILRLAYLAPLPPPRVDRHDRVVADTDREMARIGAAAQARLDTLAASLEDVPVETVIRFGRPAAELSIEAEAFGADLIVLAAPMRSRVWERVRAWQLRRAALGSKVPLILLPLAAVRTAAQSGGAVAVPALR
jgi:nucleotide-binding universal stress UspA family protein